MKRSKILTDEFKADRERINKEVIKRLKMGEGIKIVVKKEGRIIGRAEFSS